MMQIEVQVVWSCPGCKQDQADKLEMLRPGVWQAEGELVCNNCGEIQTIDPVLIQPAVEW